MRNKIKLQIMPKLPRKKKKALYGTRRTRRRFAKKLSLSAMAAKNFDKYNKNWLSAGIDMRYIHINNYYR